MGTNVNNHYLYVLVAASSVGKSALMRQITADGLWKQIPKYSTRDVRKEDNGEDDVIPLDDFQIKGKSEELVAEIRLKRLNIIKEICGDNRGIVYYKNNNIYGITINSIPSELKESNLAVIISDFHVIKKLKEALPNYVKVMYIASTVDERELLKRFKEREIIQFDESSTDTKKAIQNIKNMCAVLSSAARLNFLDKIEEVMPLLNEQWNGILPYFETIKTRAFNIRMLYNHYIDNVALIDYPILNFYDLEYMYKQARNILKNAKPLRKVKNPPVFMVCAAPSSGKATLMEIVGDLGEVNQNIVITQKYAKREKRTTDGRDGMKAIGENGAFDKYIPNKDMIWQWEFHKKEGDTRGTSYAVNRAEIEENMRNGIAQIFISNMGQIDNAIKYYPENIVILYLHATHESSTKKHIETKRKHDIIRKIISSKQDTKNDIDRVKIELEFYDSEILQKEFILSVEKDLDEINKIHMEYLENNHKIDHVLLNTGTREDLVEQMINLINYYTNCAGLPD